MSLDNAKEKCAVCGAYLFPEDDVVYCPDCGAPHHRECYSALGHCALEEYHGTDKQYQKSNNQEEPEKKTEASTVSCRMCGEEYDVSARSCPKCNAPNFARAGARFVEFDFLGGIPAEMDLGKNVTANEAKKFVAINTQRYLPKFAGFNAGRKISWNWLAFLFPCGWALSRKMYLLGAVLGALQVAVSLFSAPLMIALNTYDFSQAQTQMELYQSMSQTIIQDADKIGVWVMLIAMLGVVFNLGVRLVSGMFADLWYKKHAINTICEIKEADEEVSEQYIKRGGVSLWLGMLGIMLVSYLPEIIVTFI